MKNKYMNLTIIILLVTLLFTACKTKDNSVNKTDDITSKESSINDENTENEESSKTNDKDKEMSFQGKTLNVVATSDSYVPLFEEFSNKTGAKVEFLSMSSGEVIARTKAEGKAMADIWFGGGLDAFMAAKEEGLLENYISKNSTDVPEEYKDKDGAYIAKGLTVVGFIVNNKILEDKNLEIPKTWQDLADPKYKHEIIMSNPAISGTNYAALKGLLDLYGEGKGWTLFEKINDNIDFYSKRGKDPQEKTAQGEFAIGIIPVDKKAFEVAQDNNLTVIYPEDGICWVPEGVAIFKNSENLELAKKFVDFMLTEDAQKMIAQIDGKDTAQLVVPGVEGFNLGLPKDKLVKEDLSTFGSERERILNKFKEISSTKAE